ncbi:protein YgfX [Candidatus Macondimonas diazotrophica]|nr:protein YgfX [Candidatus Macondimonas diazotrophica]NCU00796.1 hypothetical protein [Candidatus Macondimonas diazotrophica]
MNAFARACRVEPDRSRVLAALLMSAYGMVLLLVVLYSREYWRLVLLIVWASSAGWTAWRHFGPGRILRAEFIDQDRWRIRLASGWSGEAALLPTSLVVPGLTVLNFRLADRSPLRWRHRSICLLPDSLSRDGTRRLRVFLRFH